MTNRREEIMALLGKYRATLTQRSAAADELMELFKTWALEMVGEDDDKILTPNPSYRFAINVTKFNIRQRIEESTK